MNVTYEKKQAMTFIGYHTKICPEEAYRKYPEFWDWNTPRNTRGCGRR